MLREALDGGVNHNDSFWGLPECLLERRILVLNVGTIQYEVQANAAGPLCVEIAYHFRDECPGERRAEFKSIDRRVIQEHHQDGQARCALAVPQEELIIHGPVFHGFEQHRERQKQEQ